MAVCRRGAGMRPDVACRELCLIHSRRLQGDLITHERTHTNERPFQCQLCDASYARNSLLKTHELTHADRHLYVLPHPAAHCCPRKKNFMCAKRG